jgi:hypothetical protein
MVSVVLVLLCEGNDSAMVEDVAALTVPMCLFGQLFPRIFEHLQLIGAQIIDYCLLRL